MAYGLLMKYKFHLKLTSDQLSGNSPIDLNQKKSYHTRVINCRGYYLFIFNLGAGTIRVATPNILFLKVLKIFFLHFDIINKCPLQYISVKLLLMTPLYV